MMDFQGLLGFVEASIRGMSWGDLGRWWKSITKNRKNWVKNWQNDTKIMFYNINLEHELTKCNK